MTSAFLFVFVVDYDDNDVAFSSFKLSFSIELLLLYSLSSNY